MASYKNTLISAAKLVQVLTPPSPARMLVNRVCLWTLPLLLLLAASAWSAAPAQMRLHLPSWDIGNLYSRITGAFGGAHKKTQPTPTPDTTELDVEAIDDYYNDFWENYYYNNPPYVEFIPWPRPTARPRPSRRPRPRPRPRPTTRPSTTRRPGSLATARPASSTTESIEGTPIPTSPTPPTSQEPGENGTTARPPGTTGTPGTVIRDTHTTSPTLRPQLHLSIKTPPQSVSALCHFHPQLCDQPDTASFMELIDANGQPLILIAPARTTRRPAHRAPKPTRRYHSQRVYGNDNKSIYKISVRERASGRAASHRSGPRKAGRKGRN